MKSIVISILKKATTDFLIGVLETTIKEIRKRDDNLVDQFHEKMVLDIAEVAKLK